MSTHTKGEMTVDGDPLECQYLMVSSYIVATVPGGIEDEQDRANAVRLAACWNACADIHTDILTAHQRSVMGPVGLVDMHAYNALLHKLDTARAALREIASADKSDETVALMSIAADALKEIEK